MQVKVNDSFELSNDMIHSACPHIINTIDFIVIQPSTRDPPERPPPWHLPPLSHLPHCRRKISTSVLGVVRFDFLFDRGQWTCVHTYIYNWIINDHYDDNTLNTHCNLTSIGYMITLLTQMIILLTHLVFLSTNSSCTSTSCCSTFQVD